MVAVVAGGFPETVVDRQLVQPPEQDWTVYLVMGAPPEAGAVQVTCMLRPLAVASTLVGMRGRVAGVAATVAQAPLPALLAALTRMSYAVPLASPVMVVEVPETVA